MKSVDALAVSDFYANGKYSHLPAKADGVFILKIVLILGLLVSSLNFSPVKEAAHDTLTPENLLVIINQERISSGLEPLKFNPRLEAAAHLKARDILENQYFSHLSPNGEKPWDFIVKTGFKYSYAGENLARGYTNVYELEQDFLNSPSHRENLLSPLFTETGVAIISGTYNGKNSTITVQMFASPERQNLSYK